MNRPIETTDTLSNTPEQIEQAAKIIGSGARRKVFEAIYFHKSRVKTVDEVAAVTKLSRVRVLQEGKKLSSKRIVNQVKKRRADGIRNYRFFPSI